MDILFQPIFANTCHHFSCMQVTLSTAYFSLVLPFSLLSIDHLYLQVGLAATVFHYCVSLHTSFCLLYIQKTLVWAWHCFLCCILCPGPWVLTLVNFDAITIDLINISNFTLKKLNSELMCCILFLFLAKIKLKNLHTQNY